jgi:hypothetical protein
MALHILRGKNIKIIAIFGMVNGKSALALYCFLRLVIDKSTLFIMLHYKFNYHIFRQLEVTNLLISLQIISHVIRAIAKHTLSENL